MYKKNLITWNERVVEKNISTPTSFSYPFYSHPYPSDTPCSMTELIRVAYWQLIELPTHMEATTPQQFSTQPASGTQQRPLYSPVTHACFFSSEF